MNLKLKKLFNISRSQISNCCTGRNKKTRNFIFKYKGEKLNLSDHNDNREKVVIQYDLENNKLKEWNSMAIAAKDLNIHISNISMVCNGKNKITGGFKWKYAK